MDTENIVPLVFDQGDSGGPIMCRDIHGAWKLVGVFSFEAFNCVELGRPPVFTRIQSFLPWIEKSLGNLRYYIIHVYV